MKSFILSLLSLPLLSLTGLGQTRKFSFDWPQPQPSANVPLACLPAPGIPWLGRLETNIDKFNAGPADLVFDGDSITDNWQQPGQPGPLNVWQQHYGALKAVDIGIGGDQVQNLIWRVQNGALAGQDPKLIVLMIGTNNIGQGASDVAAGIKMLIGEYETRCPHAHILLLGIFPRGNLAADSARPWISQVNDIICHFGDNDARVTYKNVGSQLLQPDGSITQQMMGDGLHPGYQGYIIVANAIQPVVAQYVTGTSTYTLTVNGGSGSGNYPAGTTVPVMASAQATNNHPFAGWGGATGALIDPNASATSLIMPPAAISITATYPSSAPASPTGLMAASGTAQTSLNWTAVTNARSYNVFRGTASAGESAIATGVAAPSFTDTNVCGGTAYYYEVKAVNSLGTSGYSNEATATPRLAQPRQISLSWPQAVQPQTVPFAEFPVPRIDWVTSFETNIDKLNAGPYDLVFDGDSITAWWDHSVWQQYYGGLKALNIGIHGDQVQNLIWRVQNGGLANQDPKLIVVLAGGNNFGQNPADVAAGIRMLLGAYKTRCSHSHILLLGILPRGYSPTDPARSWVTDVNQRIAAFADDRVTYLDIGSKFLQPDGSITHQMMPDGYNPAAQGYAIFADAIQPTINRYVSGISTPPSASTGLEQQRTTSR